MTHSPQQTPVKVSIGYFDMACPAKPAAKPHLCALGSTPTAAAEQNIKSTLRLGRQETCKKIRSAVKTAFEIGTCDSELESSPLKKQTCTEKSTPSCCAGSEVQSVTSQPFFAQIFSIGRPMMVRAEESGPHALILL
ncbi:TPA: hypothetical protein ACH3X3_008005 [Trebouxia sp. C0006]